MDVKEKESILNYEFPVHELEGDPNELRIEHYLSRSFAQAAKCAVENYRPGDEIRQFALRVPDSVEEGFVMLRNDEVIVRIHTFAVIIN